MKGFIVAKRSYFSWACCLGLVSLLSTQFVACTGSDAGAKSVRVHSETISGDVVSKSFTTRNCISKEDSQSEVDVLYTSLKDAVTFVSIDVEKTTEQHVDSHTVGELILIEKTKSSAVTLSGTHYFETVVPEQDVYSGIEGDDPMLDQSSPNFNNPAYCVDIKYDWSNTFESANTMPAVGAGCAFTGVWVDYVVDTKTEVSEVSVENTNSNDGTAGSVETFDKHGAVNATIMWCEQCQVVNAATTASRSTPPDFDNAMGLDDRLRNGADQDECPEVE